MSSGRRTLIDAVVPSTAVEYSIQDNIGSGGFGQVYKAKFKGCTVAYKVPLEKTSIPKKKRNVVAKEAEKLIESTHHEFIVALFGVVLENDHQGLILEYMLFGSCTDFIQEYEDSVDELMRFKFLVNIVSAMSWLHSRSPPIRHLDLKADNVLINDYFDAKISDFGLSEWKTATTINLSSKSRQRNGTVTHVPPEVFKDITKKGSVEEDVYAFGITAWEIFTGLKPYKDCDVEIIRSAVIEGQRPNINDVRRPRFQRFVRDMIILSWDGNPIARPRFSELLNKIEPVYINAREQLGNSIRKLRHGILLAHGEDSEEFKSTSHLNTPVRHHEVPVLHTHVGNQLRTHVGNQLHTPVGNQLHTPVGNQLHTPVGNQLHTPVGNQLHTHVGNQLHTPVGNQLHTHVGNQLHTHVGNQLHTPVGNQLHTHVGNQLHTPVGNQLHTPVGNQLHTPVGNQLHTPVGNQLHTPVGNQLHTPVGNQLHTPVGNQLHTPVGKQVNGEKALMLPGVGRDLESTPRQDGLETNFEKSFGNVSLMSPDAGARSPEDHIGSVADGRNNVSYNNNDYVGMSGVVSLTSRKYIPGHEIQHPKGNIAHPSSVEPELSGLHGGAREPGAEKSGLHGGVREPEGAEKQMSNENVKKYVTQLSDSTPDIAESFVKNKDALNDLTRHIQSRNPQPASILNPETLQQLLTIHPTENTVQNTSNNQRTPTNLGNLSGIVSADQQRSSVETANHHPPTSSAESPVPSQPSVTHNNQMGANIARPNLLYAQEERPRDGAAGTVLQNVQPGTFDRHRSPRVTIPSTQNRSPVPGDDQLIHSQVNQPSNMPTGMNTRIPINQQQSSATNTGQPFNIGQSPSPMMDTSFWHNQQSSSAPTPGQRSQDQRSAQQTRISSSTQRPSSRRQTQSQTSNDPIVISHKHGDGAITTLSLKSGVKYPPNLQIGSNMVMNINNGLASPGRQDDISRNRSQQCNISDLTTNENVPDFNTIDMVCVEIGNDWKRLCRQLDIKEPEIEQLHFDHYSAGLYEIVYQGIRSWKQRNGQQATIRKLAIALWEIERSDIAKKLR
ncbi:hypothetical protein ACF0H5_005696 [Mactra antiquata]